MRVAKVSFLNTFFLLLFISFIFIMRVCGCAGAGAVPFKNIFKFLYFGTGLVCR